MLLEFAVGQLVLRLLANVLSMVESWLGYRRSVKEVQWLIPMVWAPERATTSVGSKSLAARRARRVVVLAVGATRLSKVAYSVAKFCPSLLPNGTT